MGSSVPSRSKRIVVSIVLTSQFVFYQNYTAAAAPFQVWDGGCVVNFYSEVDSTPTAMMS